MKKIQDELRNILAQYPFAQNVMKFDLILLAIYPIYNICILCSYKIARSFSKFSTLFLLMFVVGIIFAFAGNQIKELILSLGIMAIISIVNVINGAYDGLVYAAIYGFVAYKLYEFMIGKAPIKNNNNVSQNQQAIPTKKCSKCGNEMPIDNDFCTYCGEKLN